MKEVAKLKAEEERKRLEAEVWIESTLVLLFFLFFFRLRKPHSTTLNWLMQFSSDILFFLSPSL